MAAQPVKITATKQVPQNDSEKPYFMSTNKHVGRFLPALAALVALGSGAICAHADYASTVLANGPIGYWRLNETTTAAAWDVAKNSGSLGSLAQGEYVPGATHPVPGIPGAGSDTAANFPNANGGSGGVA